MTRRDFIHKWLVYALGLLPVWLLDAYILPRYPLYGASPML
ncbi:rod shape-determining protein MreD, partial [Klebsiella oxytoca]